MCHPVIIFSLYNDAIYQTWFSSRCSQCQKYKINLSKYVFRSTYLFYNRVQRNKNFVLYYFTAKLIETFGEWFLTINNCLLLIYYGELQTHFFSRQREQSRYLKCFNAHLFIYKLLFHTFDTSESWGFLVSWCWENNPFWTLKLKHVVWLSDIIFYRIRFNFYLFLFTSQHCEWYQMK